MFLLFNQNKSGLLLFSPFRKYQTLFVTRIFYLRNKYLLLIINVCHRIFKVCKNTLILGKFDEMHYI